MYLSMYVCMYLHGATFPPCSLHLIYRYRVPALPALGLLFQFFFSLKLKASADILAAIACTGCSASVSNLNTDVNRETELYEDSFACPGQWVRHEAGPGNRAAPADELRGLSIVEEAGPSQTPAEPRQRVELLEDREGQGGAAAPAGEGAD